MKPNRSVMIFCVVFLSLLIRPSEAGRNEYIQVAADNVNIRTAPTTNSEIVGKAQKGDIFEMEERKGSWYRIHMFSGESRWVHASLAKPIWFEPSVPDEVSVRQDIYQGWVRAATQAQREADEEYPPEKDLARNLRLSQLLQDRYKLDLMHDFGVQPPIYRRIVLEGNQKGW